ncbi:MAG: hypothetical protein AB7O96_09860 [Pseudobdellovibrionaceae bacterium]
MKSVFLLVGSLLASSVASAIVVDSFECVLSIKNLKTDEVLAITQVEKKAIRRTSDSGSPNVVLTKGDVPIEIEVRTEELEAHATTNLSYLHATKKIVGQTLAEQSACGSMIATVCYKGTCSTSEIKCNHPGEPFMGYSQWVSTEIDNGFPMFAGIHFTFGALSFGTGDTHYEITGACDYMDTWNK